MKRSRLLTAPVAEKLMSAETFSHVVPLAGTPASGLAFCCARFSVFFFVTVVARSFDGVGWGGVGTGACKVKVELDQAWGGKEGGACVFKGAQLSECYPG